MKRIFVSLSLALVLSTTLFAQNSSKAAYCQACCHDKCGQTCCTDGCTDGCCTSK